MANCRLRTLVPWVVPPRTILKKCKACDRHSCVYHADGLFRGSSSGITQLEEYRVFCHFSLLSVYRQPYFIVLLNHFASADRNWSLNGSRDIRTRFLRRVIVPFTQRIVRKWLWRRRVRRLLYLFFSQRMNEDADVSWWCVNEILDMAGGIVRSSHQ